MTHFNELRITPDGNHLIIDVSVPGDTYYRPTLITSIDIDRVTADGDNTFVNSYSPSSQAINVYSSEGVKRIRLFLDSSDLGYSLNGNMLFVFVRTNGETTPDVPCGMDNITTMGTVTNMYPFYQQAMNYIGELASTCNVPQNFIDYILRLKALELAVKTGNYPDAIKYYLKFFNGKENITVRKGGCGCGNS